MEDGSKLMTQALDWAMEFGPKLLMAVATLVIGFWIAKRVVRLVSKAVEKSGIDQGVGRFLASLVDVAMKVLIILIAAGMIGFETASLVGILAAASFAVGLALQGSLANFAAGVIVLVFKPYRIDDWVEVEEKFGKVKEIQIFNTIIETPGEKTLIIPNGKIVEGIVTNYSLKGHIRMEMTVTMPYEESWPKVKKLILDTLKTIPEVKSTPEPEVGIESYDSHNIFVAVRPYVHPDDYWEVKFRAYERIKAAFHHSDIKVAYSEGVELGPIGE